MSVHIYQPSGRRTPDLAPAQPRRRDGIAMAISLMAVVLIGAMVAGASYFAMQNARASDNSRRVVQATNFAEAATAEVVNGWQPASYNLLNKGDTVGIPASTTAGGGKYQGKISKLSDQTFMLDLTAFDSANSRTRGSGARQRMGMLLKIVPIQLPSSAALTIADSVKFGGGNSIVAGADNVPAGWSGNCPPAGAGVTGVHAAQPYDIVGSAGQYTGTPAATFTPSLDTMAYTNFGGMTYTQIATGAIQVPPGATYSPSPIVNAGACVKTGAGSNMNWGDGANPTAACGTYFPVVNINGSPTSTTTLNGGQGQGMLLVNGDLVVSGTWTYYGILIVRGTFKTSGVGAPKVYGTVLAKKVDFSSTSAGNAAAVINYSACSITRASNATALSSPMRSRGYVRMM